MHIARLAGGSTNGAKPMPAQGNALGTAENMTSPERATNVVTPFQGCVCFTRSQGVALGWHVAGPLALGKR